MKKKKLILSIIVLSFLMLLPFRVMAASMLSSIEIEGVGPLNVARDSWNIGFTTTLSYVNIIATPANENVKLEGAGKVDIKEGLNTIVIKASDGTKTEEYTVYLNVGSSGSGNASAGGATTGEAGNDPVKNPDTGGFISYESMIVMVLAFAITGVLIKIKKIVHKI